MVTETTAWASGEATATEEPRQETTAPAAQAPTQETPKPVEKAPVDPHKAEIAGRDRQIAKLQRELEQAKSHGASLAEIREMRAEMKSMQAGLELVINNYGKLPEEIPEPLPNQYKRVQDQSKADMQRHASLESEQRLAEEAIKEMAEEAGLDTSEGLFNVPELKDVFAKANTFAQGVIMARKVTDKIRLQNMEKGWEERARQKREEERLRDSRDSDSVNTGAGVGRNTSFEKARADFIKDPENPKVRARYEKAKVERG